MTRPTRNRLAATTGLAALATVSLGLAFAPAALAAPGPLAAPHAQSTLVAGETLDISGGRCVADDPDNYQAMAWIDIYDDPDALNPVASFDALPDTSGMWSAQVTFPADAVGEHFIAAGCAYADSGDPDQPDVESYPEITVTVSAPTPPPTATPTPTPTPSPTTPSPTTTPTSTPAPSPTPAASSPTTSASAPSAIRGASANTPGVATQTTSATTQTAVPGAKVVKVYTGFQPFEQVTLTMHSTPQVLGTFTANGSGVLTVEFTLPAGTPAGAHTLVLAGSTTYFQEGFQVAGSPATASSRALASTGASVALPLALGAGLIVAGGGALVAARRRTGASQA